MSAAATPKVKAEISSQARFTTSKLIQNLGSNREQYKFEGTFRSAWGRD